MCDHDGTATGILRFSQTNPGVLEPVLLCQACDTIIGQLNLIPHKFVPVVPRPAASLEPEPPVESAEETRQTLTVLAATASEDRDAEIVAVAA